MLRRFDAGRLAPVLPEAVQARDCARTQRLVQACRLGAGPAASHWAQPRGPVRLELPLACYQIDDAELAARACLQLDGTWPMTEAGRLGRLALRGHALWADLAWWRSLQPTDAWDAGTARDTAALAQFVPRRTTLIVVHGEPDEPCRGALASLERQAPQFRRAVRVLLVGARLGWARHLAL